MLLGHIVYMYMQTVIKWREGANLSHREIIQVMMEASPYGIMQMSDGVNLPDYVHRRRHSGLCKDIS